MENKTRQQWTKPELVKFVNRRISTAKLAIKGFEDWMQKDPLDAFRWRGNSALVAAGKLRILNPLLKWLTKEDLTEEEFVSGYTSFINGLKRDLCRASNVQNCTDPMVNLKNVLYLEAQSWVLNDLGEV